MFCVTVSQQREKFRATVFETKVYYVQMMARFCLKDSNEYYLALSDQPKRFDADSPVTNVFFDDSNGQVNANLFSCDVRFFRNISLFDDFYTLLLTYSNLNKTILFEGCVW